MFPPATASTAARSSWTDRARRALDLAVAFATLADVDDEPFEPFHPHRRALKRVTTTPARRPGMPQSRAQACLSPVDHRARPATRLQARRPARRA
jgi:hypothetical protein